MAEELMRFGLTIYHLLHFFCTKPNQHPPLHFFCTKPNQHPSSFQNIPSRTFHLPEAASSLSHSHMFCNQWEPGYVSNSQPHKCNPLTFNPPYKNPYFFIFREGGLADIFFGGNITRHNYKVYFFACSSIKKKACSVFVSFSSYSCLFQSFASFK